MQGSISLFIRGREFNLSYLNGNSVFSSISYRMTCKCLDKLIVFRNSQILAGEGMLFAYQTIDFQNLSSNGFLAVNINNSEGGVSVGFFWLSSSFLHSDCPLVLIDIFIILYRKILSAGVNAIFLAVNCDSTKISSF